MDAAGRVWMPCARAGQSPLRKKEARCSAWASDRHQRPKGRKAARGALRLEPERRFIGAVLAKGIDRQPVKRLRKRATPHKLIGDIEGGILLRPPPASNRSGAQPSPASLPRVTEAVTPFRVVTSSAAISDARRRLQATRWPERQTTR